MVRCSRQLYDLVEALRRRSGMRSRNEVLVALIEDARDRGVVALTNEPSK